MLGYEYIEVSAFGPVVGKVVIQGNCVQQSSFRTTWDIFCKYAFLK